MTTWRGPVWGGATVWLVRRALFALIALVALGLAPAAQAASPLQNYKNNGSIGSPCQYKDGQLNKGLGDLPPDIEQYAPGYADQLRDARGAPCGGKGTPGAGGTTTGAQERVENVPVPPDAGGSGPGGSGGAGGAGATATAHVAKPPVPKPDVRARLADVTSPAVDARPGGPDVPGWVLALGIVVLLLAVATGMLFLLGADLRRFTRPLGAAGAEARARTSDRAVELWETVRFGR